MGDSHVSNKQTGKRVGDPSGTIGTSGKREKHEKCMRAQALARDIRLSMQQENDDENY